MRFVREGVRLGSVEVSGRTDLAVTIEKGQTVTFGFTTYSNEQFSTNKIGRT